MKQLSQTSFTTWFACFSSLHPGLAATLSAARRLTHSPLAVGTAALVGALIMLLSDLVARRVFAPTELPVGVVTGIVGAPYLLWLLARSNRGGRGG